MAALALLALSATSCEIDGATQGVSEQCATGNGSLLDCDDQSIESAEDACWRLVRCAAIPLANSDEEPNAFFDWARCVRHIDRLSDELYDATLACVEAATCDDLKARNAPEPYRGDLDLPLCLQHDDQ